MNIDITLKIEGMHSDRCTARSDFVDEAMKELNKLYDMAYEDDAGLEILNAFVSKIIDSVLSYARVDRLVNNKH